jgi:hypothetical protein
MMDLITQFAIECAGQKEWDFPKDPKSYTFTPDELEKFANLIVHECAHAVAQHNALSYQQSVPFNVSQVLNNHFGVDK